MKDNENQTIFESQWYDEMMSSPGSEKLSGYEQAARAWHEAVKRMKSA